MPIYFGYPRTTRYNISYEIPEGYTLESLPKPMKVSTEGKELIFSFNAVYDQNKIQILIAEEVNMSIISGDYYETIKDFYQKMIDKENEKIVLKRI